MRGGARGPVRRSPCGRAVPPAHLVLSLLLLAGTPAGCDCGDDDDDTAAVDAGPDAPTDAANDAPPGPPGPTRVACGDALLVVRHDPLSLRLEDAAGEELLATPEGAASFAMATIAAPRPEEFFDPRGDDRVTWSDVGAVSAVDTGDGETTFTVRTDVADDLVLRARCVDAGHVVLEARPTGPRDVVLSRLAFATRPGDRYHGLGEQFSGPDSRGQVRAMQMHIDGRLESGLNEVHVPVPFVVSPRGWGMFVESRRAGAFDVGATDPDVLAATFDEVGLTVHLWAGAPVDVVAAYTRQAGLPKMPPGWAFGAHFWRNENASGDEVLQDAAQFRALDIPTSVLWIDNPWQTSYNDFLFDPARFPDAETLVASLHEQGFRVLAWSTPYLDAVERGAEPVTPAEELFEDARAQGILVEDAFGAPYLVPWGGGPLSGMPDFTSEEGAAYWAELVGRATGLGIDGFKLDYGEEILAELVRVRPGIHFANGETEATMHGRYSDLYHRAYQQALAADPGEGFLIGRAGAWGGQADVDCIWPGDLDSGFERQGDGDGAVGGLPAAVSALQSLAASGYPVFGSDTGGFRNGLPDREALLRWAGHTAFSPVMQLGGGGESHAPWAYDDEAVDAYRAFARWHVDLAPTMQALVEAASTDGTPVVRAMALAFPDDPDALDRVDQYMLGPDLLVAPLVDGGTARSVYLPAGRWLDLFTGEVHTGPTTVVRETPLDEVPAYLRAGGVLTLGAPDIDTLAPTDDPEVVDAADRADVRRILAFGDASGRTAADHPRVTLTRAADSTTVTATGGETVRLLLALHLPDSAAATVDGAGMSEAAAVADVTAGCACWAYDGGARVLWVGMMGRGEMTVR